MSSFLPRREVKLVNWSRNFDSKIQLNFASIGLTATQVAEYTALNGAFASAFQTANSPHTRTRTAVVAKNMARDALKAKARELAAIVRAFPGTTRRDRAVLGLAAPDEDGTRIGLPAAPPKIEVTGAAVHRVSLRLFDREHPMSMGKPAGVDGATVFSSVGLTPPQSTDLHAWNFEGVFGQTRMTIQLPHTVLSGATAWFTAFWFNPRKQAGPPAKPVYAQIPGSLTGSVSRSSLTTGGTGGTEGTEPPESGQGGLLAAA